MATPTKGGAPSLTRTLSRHEAARFLQVSVDAIDRFLQRDPDDNPLPRLKAGRRFLFLAEDLIAWAREEAERARTRKRRSRRGGAR